MQAIRTRYHGSTNTKGSRISAQCEAGRIYVEYDHVLNLDGNHKAACETLRRKLNWNVPTHAPMYSGVFAGDWYWVFQADDERDIARS
jgi:hypothetical protein